MLNDVLSKPVEGVWLKSAQQILMKKNKVVTTKPVGIVNT